MLAIGLRSRARHSCRQDARRQNLHKFEGPKANAGNRDPQQEDGKNVLTLSETVLPDQPGTQHAVVDSKGTVYLLDALSERATRIPDPSPFCIWKTLPYKFVRLRRGQPGRNRFTTL